uniref:Receptor-type tyrosine-protein phosphatase kappa n=1 Tax=Ascaris suum TaxID=6253 RepID=F1L153_ASCSU
MGNALRRSRRKRKKMKTARMIPLAQMPVKKAQHAAQKSKRDISSEVDDNGSRREDDRSSSETDTHRSSRSVEASSKSSTLTRFIGLRKKAGFTANSRKTTKERIRMSPSKKPILDDFDDTEFHGLSLSSSRDSSTSQKSQRSKFELDESSRSEDSSKGALDEKLLRASVRSKHRKRSPSRIQFATDRPSNVVNAQMKQAVEQWVERTLQKGVRGLLDEFAQLRSESSPSADAYQHFTDNQPFGRNRYKDIFCLDESRIVLRGHPKGNDYIHANYVSTPLMPNRFICTQAPKEETIYDFWLMVVQERIEVIVMLGDFVEKGKQKCAVYFPRKQNEVFTTNDVIIRCDSVTTLTEFNQLMLRRSLAVKRNEASFNVTHYHWSSWPDHSVPVADRAPFMLFQMVRAANRPICVHCSAGVGRTGSVVTIAYILECLLSNVQFKDLVQVLKQLRKQRAGIVQTEMQYLYVHRILLMCFMDMKLIGTSDRLNKFIREYNRLVSPVQ